MGGNVMVREVLRQTTRARAVGHGKPFSTDVGSILSVIWAPTEDLEAIDSESDPKSL